MSKVLNMVGGGGGGADSFMELIGATEKVETTYTPLSDARSIIIPFAGMCKGIYVKRKDDTIETGYTRYIHEIIAHLDSRRAYAKSMPSGNFAYRGNLYFFGDIANTDLTGNYITNNGNNGVHLYFEGTAYTFKGGSEFEVTLFY